MSRLAPNLLERRYGDLVQIGRSRLPSYAPAWTDHNVHDPGITLIELLAWVSEAQLYSLARTRRDERRAYAELMGVKPHGARPARGMLWPDHADPTGPGRILTTGRIIERDQAIHLERSETPVFRALHRQVWIPAQIVGLQSKLSDGIVVDHLEANKRSGPAFQPFGTDEGREAVLRMTLESTGHAPLLELGRPDDARLMIGVRTDTRAASSRRDSEGASPRSPIEVTLDFEGRRFELPVVEDGTEGMLQTGVLVLDVSAVDVSANTATLEFRSPGGFERAPRIVRIEPNVVPIVQKLEKRERHDGNGLPDQAFDLETPGLEFEPGAEPVTIEVETLGKIEKWSQVDRLDERGPDDLVFCVDPVAARVTFGNGVNGRRPPAESAIFATYSVSEGQAGNIAANRKWVIAGFGGLFGVNPDPTAGGEEASGWLEQRRDARRALRDRHALVSARDFEEAARALDGLEVGRASMVAPDEGDLATGTMRLLSMRTRPGGREPENPPETTRWLRSVRDRLAPRAPLGSRLRVIAPKYVEFSIRARLEAEPKQDPEAVRQQVIDELARRLTLVSDKPGIPQRPFGVPVTRRDLIAWMQALPGVRRVVELSIQVPGRTNSDEVPVPKIGLPRIDLTASQISVDGSGASGGAS